MVWKNYVDNFVLTKVFILFIKGIESIGFVGRAAKCVRSKIRKWLLKMVSNERMVLKRGFFIIFIKNC